jgi:hypothetical protein
LIHPVVKENSMERPYTVALHGGGALPAAQKIAAEVGFITALERSLGDPGQVEQSYRAAAAAAQAKAMEPLAHRWVQAYAAAAQDTIRAHRIGADARFELRLTRAASGPD